MKKWKTRLLWRLQFGTIRRWAALSLSLALLLPAAPALAQDTPPPSGAYYVIQTGDTLWDIALRFGVSMDSLMAANNITNADAISLGTPLSIPGLEGVRGELVTEKVGFGETLRSLSRGLHVPADTIMRLNHLTSPAELYAGATLIVPKGAEASTPAGRAALASGQSLLELAALHGANPWAVAQANELEGAWSALPGDVLRIPGAAPAGGAASGPGALPEEIRSVTLSPLPPVQGGTTVIRVEGPEGMELRGSLAGNELHFFPAGSGDSVALQGIHAMLEPGLYPLTLIGALPGGGEFGFSQPVFVVGGDYLFDPALTVSPETIDPAVTRPEDAQWAALSAPSTPEKLWNGTFQSPVPDLYKDCFPSVFGSRRSFNGSAYTYYHSGLDFCGGVGTEVYAPAAGKVVFAGPLTVRGNAIMIDHGWGVYTGYMHLSEIDVNVGETVKPGQLIGLIGGTGRVTGPHLHWEVFVGDVQVNPMDWLKEEYP